MNQEKTIENIELLSDKASKSDKSDDALRFSQAACNLANTFACVTNIKLAKP